jgi:hypothetical protein
VYKEAPGFRPGPRIVFRAEAYYWERALLSVVHVPLSTYLYRPDVVVGMALDDR